MAGAKDRHRTPASSRERSAPSDDAHDERWSATVRSIYGRGYQFTGVLGGQRQAEIEVGRARPSLPELQIGSLFFRNSFSDELREFARIALKFRRLILRGIEEMLDDPNAVDRTEYAMRDRSVRDKLYHLFDLLSDILANPTEALFREMEWQVSLTIRCIIT
jgi:hypothetical protein